MQREREDRERKEEDCLLRDDKRWWGLVATTKLFLTSVQFCWVSLYTTGKGKRKRVKSVGLNDLGVKDDHLSLLFAAFPFFLRGVLILSLFLSKDLSEEHCNRGLKPSNSLVSHANRDAAIKSVSKLSC